MHQPHRRRRRQVRRQPCDQALHVVDLFGLRGAVLLRPALDLARHVILPAAEIGKAERGGIERMQPCQRGIHGIVDGHALTRGGARHVRLPEHAPFDIAHDVEGGAEDRRIVAEQHRLGHRKAGRMQRADDAELAVNSVGRGQQLARRLPPQHVAARRRLQQIGRIRLAAFELAHAQRTRKVRKPRLQIRSQLPGIECDAGGNVLGAGKRRLTIDLRHSPGIHSSFISVREHSLCH